MHRYLYSRKDGAIMIKYFFFHVSSFHLQVKLVISYAVFPDFQINSKSIPFLRAQNLP